MAFRILSIDGGGLRGIVPALVLKHVQDLSVARRARNTVVVPADPASPDDAQFRIQNSFDLLAGASTGALIAAGLSVADRNIADPRHTIDDLIGVYRNRGKVIFPIKNRLHACWRRQDFSYLFRPQFRPDGLDSVLRSLLYEPEPYSPTLWDCTRPLFICSYDLATNSPLIFTTRAALDNPKQNVKLIDACRATSAGPTYLPPYRFALEHAHDRASTDTVTAIDGGIFMNNPAMAALMEVLSNQRGQFYDVPDLDLSDIYLLSIGTGHLPQRIAERSRRWGRYGWIKPALEVMMWGSSQAVDDQVRTALGLRARSGRLNYLRINVEIKDRKFADMANSDAASLKHMEERFEEDFMRNAFIQDQLLLFIEHAELDRAS